jgi:hypothetical protein
MTDEQGHTERRKDATVDGPTAMTPTTGRFGGPPPDAPHPATPEPTVPDSAQTESGGSTAGRLLDEPTAEPPAAAPLAEPTIAELATTYGPTTYAPTTGHHETPTADPTGASTLDQPTIAEPTTTYGPTTDHHEPPTTDPARTSTLDQPTIAEPTSGGLTGNRPITSHHGSATESTLAIPLDEPASAGGHHNEPPAVTPLDEPIPLDESTAAVGTDDPTATGPTVGSWPFDEFEPPPPGELVRQADPPGNLTGHPQPAPRSPAYYVFLGAAVVLVVGLVALAAVVTVMRPRHEVAGTAVAAGADIPSITPSGQQPPPSTAQGPLAAVAAHPLSRSTARMADATCALPRFDPADDKQAAFYAAAKVCADNAWRGVLQQAGLDGGVTVVMVTGAVQTDCGDLAPTVAPTECDGTVYLTPAYLRDTEQNGRYPGRYLGVFLREYARALQDATGLDELVGAVTTGTAADLDIRVDQQATCLAGVVSGAMSGRGAIDANITGEIRARLTTVDAPKDAQAWLDKGFQQRTPAACNAWLS